MRIFLLLYFAVSVHFLCSTELEDDGFLAQITQVELQKSFDAETPKGQSSVALPIAEEKSDLGGSVPQGGVSSAAYVYEGQFTEVDGVLMLAKNAPDVRETLDSQIAVVQEVIVVPSPEGERSRKGRVLRRCGAVFICVFFSGVLVLTCGVSSWMLSIAARYAQP